MTENTYLFIYLFILLLNRTESTHTRKKEMKAERTTAQTTSNRLNGIDVYKIKCAN